MRVFKSLRVEMEVEEEGLNGRLDGLLHGVL